MKCLICKRSIGKRERRFYSIHRSRTGHPQRRYWCVECDQDRIDKVDEALSHYDKKETTEL